MERIQSFKSFSDVKKQLREEATLKETSAKRDTSAAAFSELLKKYNATSVSEVTEDQLQDFMSELVGDFKFEKTNESVETIEENRNALPKEGALEIIKAFGEMPWGEGKAYGEFSGIEILRALGLDMAKSVGIDKTPGNFKYPYSIYFDGGDLVLGDKTVGKTRGKTLSQVSQMYTALVGKALTALAKEAKRQNSNESLEVIEEGNKNREMVASAWMKSGIKDLNGIARLYADAMEDANFHQEIGTSTAIGSASRGKIADLKGSDIASAAGWDGYAIANGTVDYLKEIGEDKAANKLYKAISKYDLNESIAFATTDLVTAIMEGTRGQFGKIYKSGEIASVYTHYDSYPEHMLPTIKKGYKKGTDVDAVLGKGDNSGLEVSPDKMKFYGDPRSLKPTMGNVKNLKKYISDVDGQGAEYIYLFDERDQKWYMIEVYGDRELVPAFESVVNELKANEAYEVEMFWKGLSGDEAKIGKFLVSKKDYEKLEDNFAGDIEFDLYDDTAKGKVVKYNDVITAMRNTKYGKIAMESVVTEAEVMIFNEIGAEIESLYSKLNDLAEETTDSAWRKAIENIIKGVEGIEKNIGKFDSKLGVIPTHESVEVNENMELKKLEDAIKMFQDKIKSQGRVTNARDEDHLENLIRIYKEMGGKNIKESAEVNEAEINNEEEFRAYAEEVLKKAHGEDYDEAKAKEAIDGILAKADGDFGAAVGMLTSGLGEAVEANEDMVPGGLADGMTAEDLAKKHGVEVAEIEAAIEKGIKVEMEHTDDNKIAKEVAMDHIFEDPKYYDKLADMENESEEVEEGNTFGAARAEAIAKGEEEFEVDGEKFPVEDVSKEDEENAKEFADEAVEEGNEEKVALELYVKLVDKNGEFSEDQMSRMSLEEIEDYLKDNEDLRGSQLKKVAKEVYNIATSK